MNVTMIVHHCTTAPLHHCTTAPLHHRTVRKCISQQFPASIQNHNLPKIFLSIPDKSTFEDAYGPF
ncbi:hypothetical protein, partial [Escherichia albertii]|uniref:hypothetical protein n=1 Tax=Escherichia albertii TaxID=208962 RepID=UPI001ED98BC6